MSYARVSIQNPARFLKSIKIHPGMFIGAIIIAALFFFEVFNFSTTDYALRDLLGDLRFAGVRWSTTLTIAFCAIDFAGVARLFTPTSRADEPKEAWYLFGAWLLAATMNAALTWWGVAMAIANHTVQSAVVIDQELASKVVPVFVAIMVWTIRILIIGTITLAGNRIFGGSSPRSNRQAIVPSRRVEVPRRDSTSIRPMAPVTARRPNSTRPTITIDPKVSAAPIAPRPTLNTSPSPRAVPVSPMPRPAIIPEPKAPPSLAMPRPTLPTTAKEETPAEPTYHSLSASASSSTSSRIGENSASNVSGR